ncbi:MAG TPA: glycosyltransferase, partial [Verrucomicrobiae bacterium]|nr:glycosyltransferase [Verrucomicrobiae bacterium]
MKPPLLIVSPEFPPRRGGVADHTANLAAGLGERFKVKVLTSAGDQLPGNGEYQVLPLITTWSSWVSETLLNTTITRLASGVPVLWQYVPHMYGKGGVNPAIPRVMRKLRAAGTRQLVIAHEIAAPLSPWPHRLRYALAHRRQWRGILEAIDAVGISTEAWLREWAAQKPARAAKLFLSPSPASIPVTPVAAGHPQAWREANGLPATARVLAYFGTISGNRRVEWLFNAWRRAQSPEAPGALVFLGDEPVTPPVSGLESLYRPLGFLPAAQVSQALQAADLLALPFTDGVSERRTTFMAGLSHGLPVLTTLGHNTGLALRQADFFRAVDCADGDNFAHAALELLRDDSLRLRLGAAGRQAYER